MWPVCGFFRNHGIQLENLLSQTDFDLLGHCSQCTHLTFMYAICLLDLYKISADMLQIFLKHLLYARHCAMSQGIKDK